MCMSNDKQKEAPPRMSIYDQLRQPVPQAKAAKKPHPVSPEL